MKWRLRVRSVLPLSTGFAWVRLTHLSRTIQVETGVRAISRPSVRYVRGAKIYIGAGVVLNSSAITYHTAMPSPVTLIADTPRSRIRIGSCSRINGATIHAQSEVTIGARVLMAAGATILDSNGHSAGHLDRTRHRDVPRPVFIGDDVWIGINAIILPGSHIGAGSVVGANAVVSGTIPPHSIVRPSATVTQIHRIGEGADVD